MKEGWGFLQGLGMGMGFSGSRMQCVHGECFKNKKFD